MCTILLSAIKLLRPGINNNLQKVAALANTYKNIAKKQLGSAVDGRFVSTRCVMRFVMQQILCCLVLMAMIAHSLIPAGFMPDADAAEDGRFRLVICTGYGPLSTTADSTQTDHSHHQDDAEDHSSHYQSKAPCAFSMDSTVILAMGISVTQTGIITWRQAVFNSPQHNPPTASLRKTAPPRAPPVYS